MSITSIFRSYFGPFVIGILIGFIGASFLSYGPGNEYIVLPLSSSSGAARLPGTKNGVWTTSDNGSWPPVLFPSLTTYTKPEADTLDCLVSVVHDSTTGPGANCLALYLQSGSALGKYRQGGPLKGDSDIDIRVVRNFECARAVYDALPQRVAKCKHSSRISLNTYEKWGYPETGLTKKQTDKPNYPHIGHTAMVALLSTLTYTTIDSTSKVSFFIRQPRFLLEDLRRQYGPAWFVPSGNHGIHTATMRLGYRATQVKSQLCSDVKIVDADFTVDNLMNKLGAKKDGYAYISQLERCRAGKWFAWIERFCRGEVQLPPQYNEHFPSGSTAWAFPECKMTSVRT